MTISRRGKRRLAALVLMVLLAAAGVVAIKALRATQERKIVALARTQGLAAYQQGDLGETLRQLSHFFEYDKNDFDVNFTFAEARARVPIAGGRHLWEAVDLYSTHCLRLLRKESIKVADKASKELLIQRRLLDLYCQLGVPLEVRQTADAILKSEPDDISALSAKCEALCMNREFTQAGPITEKLIALEPNHLRWRRWLLDIQRETGHSNDQRLQQCRLWTHEQREADMDGRFHLLTAAMLMEMHREEEAIEELRDAAERGAHDAEVLAATVELLDLLDQRDASESLIARVIDERGNQLWPFEIAIRRAWRANRLDDCLALLEAASASVGQTSIELQKLHVLALTAAQRFDEARAKLTPIQQLPTTRRDKDADRAWADAMIAALDAASIPWQTRKETVRKALALGPNDASLHSLMGDVWLEVGELSQAVQHYQRAFTLDPQWLAAGVACVDAMLRAGRIDQAYHTSRLVITHAERGQIDALLLFARTFLSLNATGWIVDETQAQDDLGGDLLMVLRKLESMQLGPPHHASVMGLLAEATAQFEGEETANELIRFSLSESASDTETLRQFGAVALRHDLQAMNDLADHARSLEPLPLELVPFVAEYELRAGNIPAAVQAFDAALVATKSGDQRLALNRLKAEFLLRADQKQAISILRELIATNSDDVALQQLALSAGWSKESAEVWEAAHSNLVRILGETSQHVMLAEADRLVRQPQVSKRDADLARAIRQVETVLERSPDSLAALSLMAEASMLAEPPNYERAISCLERATMLFPAESHLTTRLIALLQERGDYVRAGQYLRVLANISQKQRRLQPVELQLWQYQPDFETALVRASAIVRVDSPLPEQLVLAAMYQRAGKIQEAEGIYERLRQTNPNDSLLETQSADFLATTGRFDEAVQSLTQWLSRANAANADYVLGAFHQRHGRIAEARPFLERAAHQQSDAAAVQLELAWNALARKDRAAAADHAALALQSAPRDTRLHSALAMASIGLTALERTAIIKKLRTDQRIAKAAAESGLIELLQLLASIPMHDGRYAPTPQQLLAARKTLESMNSSLSRFLPAWQAVIQLHKDAHAWVDCVAIARSAVSRFPAQPEPSQWATQLLIESLQFREALPEAQEWRRRIALAGGDPIDADLAIAAILGELHRPDEAIQRVQMYERQLWSQRDRWPERLGVWVRCRASSEIPLAQDRFADQVRMLFNEDVRWREAWLANVAGMPPARALEALNLLQCCASQPQEHLALIAEYVMLGNATGDTTCFNQARLVADKLKSMSGQQFAAEIAFGTIAAAETKWTEAESHYRQALALDSDNAFALNNLAFALSHDPVKCSEALILVDRAIASSPNQAAFHETRARILLLLERASDAEQAAAQAKHLEPADLGIALTAIEIQMHQGRRSVASDLMDLQQRLRLQRRPDPSLQARFDQIWQEFQQSRADSAL